MAKFLSIISGAYEEIVALVASTGAADANKVVQTGADGKLDGSLIPGTDVVVSTSAEALTGGDWTYVNATGKIARASAAAGGHYATGFVKVNSAAAAPAVHWQEGQNTSLTALTPGSRVYLSATTPGGSTQVAIDNTLTANAGKTHQYLGDAISATSVGFEGDDGVKLA